MKKIIVPVDFSEQSEYALQAAALLAKKHSAEIFVLHMLELSRAIISTPDGMYYDQTVFFIQLAEKKFETFLQKPYLKDIKVTPIIKHYKVYQEVNDIVEKHQADLIVMGSNGADGLSEIFIGSNAEKMVRNSEVPVLVIKESVSSFTIENIAFGCDFKEENLAVFKKVLAFAKTVTANVNPVFINTPGEDFLDSLAIEKRIASFLAMADVQMQVDVFNDYTVEKGILHYSEDIKADLIAIPTHGRKGLSHLFMGSIGEDIVNHAIRPVITFKI